MEKTQLGPQLRHLNPDPAGSGCVLAPKPATRIVLLRVTLGDAASSCLAFIRERRLGLSDEDREQFDRLLSEVRQGEPGALDRLVPLVYNELEGLARAQRLKWQGQVSVQTTSLLHEAYVRLAGQQSPNWKDRTHFMAVAATAMRQILIDHARRRNAKKRGGDQKQVNFDELEAFFSSPSQRLEARDAVLMVLDDCLAKLGEMNERSVRIVECRFFAGMTIAETAEALEISPATVNRSWNTARAWLYRELRDGLEA
jgi:RNA polymerase sigma factor (TIGR02999 family)